MKNFSLIILILFLCSCGYTSIYKNQKSQDIQMNIIEVKGDNELNNLIKNEIRLYSNKDSNNIYDLKITTDYKKEVLTKNSAGVITDFNLVVTSKFTINYKEIIKNVQFNENIKIKSETDTFEQNIYEKNIKSNFASSIREKLISEILKISDN